MALAVVGVNIRLSAAGSRSTAAGRPIRAACWGSGVDAGASRPSWSPSYAVRWLGDTCRVGRMYKTGETIHLQAFCWSADGERSFRSR